jgi:hypothetical protein
MFRFSISASRRAGRKSLPGVSRNTKGISLNVKFLTVEKYAGINSSHKEELTFFVFAFLLDWVTH